MNTPPELGEQLRESRKENREFRALDSIADIITCQDDDEEDEDEDPEEEGEEEEEEEDREEGEVDKYYLGRRSSVIGILACAQGAAARAGNIMPQVAR